MGNPRKGNGARRRSTVRWLRSQARPCWICGAPIDYGVPAGDPEAFECDELVPVSRGGSPYDRHNVAAAHRCCNGWRGNRSVADVAAARRALASRGLAWSSPLEFVALARGLRKPQKVAEGPLSARPHTTTDW